MGQEFGKMLQQDKHGSSFTTMEFAVEMTCSSCEEAVKKSLHNVEGIQTVNIDLSNQQVIVETCLPSGKIQQLLEGTGKTTVFRGHGYKTGSGHVGAAVSIMLGDDVNGVIRFVQLDEDRCVIDGTVDGLTAGFHGLHIHELGDLSRGCESAGEHFNPTNARHGDREDSERHVGDLGNISADETGRAVFRMEDNLVKVWDVIGRSMVIGENEDDLGKGNDQYSAFTGNSGRGVACGIIARSAGLFQNDKKICNCSGKTLWEEREIIKDVPDAQL